MKDHIIEALDMFKEEVDGHVSSPTYRDLFDTYDETSPQLDKDFHSVVAKLLFITKRARPDLETAISYLTTRVSK